MKESKPVESSFPFESGETRRVSGGQWVVLESIDVLVGCGGGVASLGLPAGEALVAFFELRLRAGS